MIFLDQLTKTKPSSSVLEIMNAWAKEHWISFAAPYATDRNALSLIDKGIATLYELVGASESDSFFVTKGESENIAKVLHFVYKTRVYAEGKNFLATPKTECAPILEAFSEYSDLGCELNLLPVNEFGQVTKEILEKHLSPKTAILALSWVHPLTGVVQPIWELAEVCKKKGVLIYVQASEALQKLFFRFSDLPIDFLSFSADKFHGPQGIGGLFWKNGAFSKKEILRSSIPQLMGLVKASEELLEHKDSACMELAFLRNFFESELAKRVPNVVFFADKTSRVPHVSCFAIPGIRQELLAFRLAKKGVFLSFGGGENQRLEAVLVASHVDSFRAKSSLSASFTLQTTEEELLRAVEVIEEEALQLSKMGAHLCINT